MANCSCGCQHQAEKKAHPGAEKKIYLCQQCNTFKPAPSGTPAPECCGQKMVEID